MDVIRCTVDVVESDAFENVTERASGFIDWKIAAEFVVGGALGGIFGMKAAVRLSAKKRVLNYVFAGVVFSAAAYMLVRTGFHLFSI